jgi:hypothetical protein
MLRLALASAIALVLTSAAFAQGCADYVSTVIDMSSHGATVVEFAGTDMADEVVKADKISGETHVNVTRAFEVTGPGGSAIGLEIASCLLDPIWIWKLQQNGPGA